MDSANKLKIAQNILFVFLGAGIGGTLRYALSMLLPFTPNAFATNTFLVNCIGAFCIGLFAAQYHNNDTMRLFLLTGLCGGFTTFSAFSLEVLQLLEFKNISLAIIYSSASVLACVLCCWLGGLLGAKGF
jgi:CrcB protein